MMTKKPFIPHVLPLLIVMSIIFISIGVFAQTIVDDTSGRYTVPIWSPNSQYAIYEFTNAKTGETNLFLRDNNKTIQLDLDINGIMNLDRGAFWENDDIFWFVGSDVEYSDVSISLHKTLYSINIKTSEIQAEIDFTSEWTDFSFNSLTKQVVFVELEDEYSEIMWLDIESGEYAPLLFEQSYSSSAPLWSPNGTKLAFVTRDYIGIYQESGTTEYIDIQVPGGVNRLAWAPDSSALIFVGHVSESGIYIIDVDSISSDPQLILDGTYSYISWSTDGSQIAYTTLGIPGENQLFITSADTLNLNGYAPR